MPQGKEKTTLRKSKSSCLIANVSFSAMIITNFVYSLGETHREEEVSGPQKQEGHQAQADEAPRYQEG